MWAHTHTRSPLVWWVGDFAPQFTWVLMQQGRLIDTRTHPTAIRRRSAKSDTCIHCGLKSKQFQLIFFFFNLFYFHFFFSKKETTVPTLSRKRNQPKGRWSNVVHVIEEIYYVANVTVRCIRCAPFFRNPSMWQSQTSHKYPCDLTLYQKRERENRKFYNYPSSDQSYRCRPLPLTQAHWGIHWQCH